MAMKVEIEIFFAFVFFYLSLFAFLFYFIHLLFVILWFPITVLKFFKSIVRYKYKHMFKVFSFLSNY